MKYSTVEIRPRLRFEKGTEWEINLFDDDTDRVRVSTAPMGMGFYHYPKYIGLQRAFDKLKNKLIREHKAAIAGLEKSLQKLEDLQLPKQGRK